MNDRKHPRSDGRFAGHRRTHCTGLIVLVLFLGTDAAALVLTHLYHLSAAQTLVAVLLSGGAVPTLYLSWVTYSDARRDATRSENLAGVADQLARLVGRQWKKEAGVRRLNDPYPLPVRWVSTDEFLADSWDVQVTLATTGAGWPAPPPPCTWAAGPEDLAGGGRDLVGVLSRAPAGRLVVLGEPGAGKTMLMVGLVLDLLLPQHRASGGPVPVLVSLASWNPDDQDLRQWLADRLTISYPTLATAAPPGTGESTRIEALLEEDLILPILDGLDEIPKAVRGPAIAKINDALRPGEKLVLTCRTEQYKEAVQPPNGAKVTLTGAAAVQLCPLDADAVSEYLRHTGGGEAAERWQPVLDVLGTQGPAGKALTTPLMVGLARTIYNPRPGELAGNLRDPAELCSPVITDREAVEQHLFDSFIPAAYRADPACRWTAQQAEAWLVFLARHLDHTIDSPDLAWWQLRQAIPRAVIRNMFLLTGGRAGGLLAGLVAGLAVAATAGHVAGLAAGLTVGLAVWLAGGPGDTTMGGLAVLITGGLTTWLAGGLIGGLAAGLAGGMAAGIAVSNKARLSGGGRWLRIRAGMGAGLVVWFVAGLAVGLTDGLAGLGDGVGDGLVAGLVVGVTWMVWSKVNRSGLVIEIMGGLVSGLVGGLTVGLAGRLVVCITFGFVIFAILAAGAVEGSLTALFPIFDETRRVIRPSTGMRFGSGPGFLESLFGTRPANLRTVLVVTDGAGFAAGLAGVAGLAAGIGIGLVAGAGVVAGLVAGAGAALVVGAKGLTNVPGFLAEAPSPRAVLARDRQTALLRWFWVGLGYALVFGLIAGLVAGLAAALLTGLTVGLMAGLRHSMMETAWPSFGLARPWLALHRRQPWSVMSFLDDAHQRRGVLRQDGAVYQFRHIELQRRLATRPCARPGGSRR